MTPLIALYLACGFMVAANIELKENDPDATNWIKLFLATIIWPAVLVRLIRT